MDKNKKAWKTAGVICSSLWLFAAGCFSCIYWICAQLAKGNPYPHSAKGVDTTPDIIFNYMLFGVGPVIGFTLLMKKLDQPLEPSAIAALVICGALPFAWLLLQLLPWLLSLL